MQKEISKAVDIFHKIALGGNHKREKIPEVKLAAFNSALTELLTARYENNWYPENPNRGSGYRCIRVNNQSVDPTILESLQQAQIKYSKDLIVTEVTIWVDPGVVSFRIGEDGSIGSEVVDKNVYNIGKEVQSKESDEGFSSRSSTPEMSSSSSSESACSSKSSSPIPTQYSSPTIYPTQYQLSTTPNVVQQQRNPSPVVNHLLPATTGSQRWPAISFAPTLMPSSNRDIYSHTGTVPVSETQHATAINNSLALFSNQEHSTFSGSSFDGFGKVAFNPYHTMSMMYGVNLQQQNFYDIPAMA